MGSFIKKYKEEIEGKPIKEFYRFLKDNNIFMLYFRTIKDDKDPDNVFFTIYGRDLLCFFKKCPPDSWLNACFTWAKQKEGREFWEQKHNKWFSFFHSVLTEKGYKITL